MSLSDIIFLQKKTLSQKVQGHTGFESEYRILPEGHWLCSPGDVTLEAILME